MAVTLHQLPDIPASTAPDPFMEWAAERLLLVGFEPADARYFGLSSLRSSELEAAMADLLVRATLEASGR